MEQDFKVVTSKDELSEEEKSSVIELEQHYERVMYPAIEEPPIVVLDQDIIKSGQESRRERRAKKREVINSPLI